jgi:aspartyl-tRNA(Asn)/glutamyl-tRNA(Gln) amidotransferase subunit C
MKIEDLKETAELAHLNLRDDELAAAFPAFEQMLGYFAAMQAADSDKEAFPVSSAAGLSAGQAANARTAPSTFFRSDAASAVVTGVNLNENILNNAGDRDGRFLVIPNVL